MLYLLLGNVHAWDVPSYVRVNGGARMWFTVLQGDLLQNDRTKLDLTQHLGIKEDQLVWEFFSTVRVENIHVFRARLEAGTDYNQSSGGSFQKIRDLRLGYDLDFFMTPQILFGANVDLGVVSLETKVGHVTVAKSTYNYQKGETRVVPTLGIHGTFYPIVEGVALRPNVSARVNWWNYESIETWDWEVASGVDIPVNKLWTWSVNGGYKFWHVKFKRDVDKIDMNRQGFFLESAVLF